MDGSTTSVIRDVFLIIAAGLLAALCAILIVAIAKLYRPIRETVHNSRRTTEDLSAIAKDFRQVSQETSENLAQTSRNLVNLTEKTREGTEELAETVASVKEAADSIASAAATATRIAEMVGCLIPEGTGAGTSGVGTLLRVVRGLLGGRQREGGGAAEQEG